MIRGKVNRPKTNSRLRPLARFGSARVTRRVAGHADAGQKVFSFVYANSWLATAPAQVLEPTLQLYTRPQYLAAFPMRQGAQVKEDLTELWRRIVFNICVANTDDHLRNLGFLFTAQGRRLSPAYDFNPVPYGRGVTFNISESENVLDLQLTLEVAPYFRLALPQTKSVTAEVVTAVRGWRAVAKRYQLSREEQELIASAFRVADS